MTVEHRETIPGSSIPDPSYPQLPAHGNTVDSPAMLQRGKRLGQLLAAKRWRKTPPEAPRAQRASMAAAIAHSKEERKPQ